MTATSGGRAGWPSPPLTSTRCRRPARRAGPTHFRSDRHLLPLAGALLIATALRTAETAPIDTSGPVELVHCRAGDLVADFRHSVRGIELTSLTDATSSQTVLATNGAPLFTVGLRHIGSQEERTLTASEGWRETSVRRAGATCRLRWAAPVDLTLKGIAIEAVATLDDRQSAFRWTLRVDNQSRLWSVRQVVFPQLTLADLGAEAKILFPRGPGEVQRGVWGREFNYRGTYPDGWCSMAFMAAYREGDSPTGLYVGQHDPWGSTKQLELKSAPAARTVRLGFEVPASNLGQAGNGFTLSGTAVWQLLHGDWFDAATIYRAWARREAHWWPRLQKEGRTDSPLWMRELSAWVMTGGAPEECVPAVKRFRQALGLPLGFHWYNWHQIPFDNDYPHYFPTKPGFARGVAELQQDGVFVMPYINGRLWDSHDHGAEDGEFSRVALPAATKQEDGQPYLESYGSKETNGQPVRLAVMCPTTQLWRETVQGIILRLLRDEGTRGVYIDQVAAARPTLCMDPRHGHPLGGGAWWTQGYWNLMQDIRRHRPAGTMLTTECNGEAYVQSFDGYLTWHWQHDCQVPAFPAVYGGAIQMFGRAYRGGATKDLALRMKAAQQLTFGEQIGWFDPGLASEPANFEFLRQAIRTRWNHRRYFYAGEMARPPRLRGPVPTVKADWQWSGEWWVTTDAVLTGAWRLPAEGRELWLFANVSDQPVKATLRFEPGVFGLPGSRWQRTIRHAGAEAGPASQVTVSSSEEAEFPPRSVQSWEMKPAR